MDSPNSMFLLIAAYLSAIPLIKVIMKNRQPFELRTFLMFYNLVQVVGTFYIFSEVKIEYIFTTKTFCAVNFKPQHSRLL
jgi:hypothetical protein